jgi:hypothetical protein
MDALTHPHMRIEPHPQTRKIIQGFNFTHWIYIWLFQMMDYSMMVSGSMFPQSRTEKAIVIPA